MNTTSLSDVSDEELVDEMRRRDASLVVSVWDNDDFRGRVNTNIDSPFSEEKITEVAKLLLTRMSEGLQDALADCGNHYIDQCWKTLKDEVFAQIHGDETPAP